ncbi:hypothetical protein CC86DRAFT_448011 [Ophiobolus disseminans]|uniref:Deoxyribonuclease NucA/NucB domain-containing protein n=1 Tax=Ophiobolus disseminans TaxID=1469910 RepID=A0A6A6ZP45_9PLEO|nr:hypothetical protein CC86DRAFT_448011 [Ophiobolus disseminans]
MFCFLAFALLVQTSLGSPLEKRATDYGTFQVDCKGSENACNNACYYIRCLAPNDPDNNKITYVGTGHADNDRNRIESGCQVNNPQGSSICRAFPFSQAFSNKLATDWQCDEWPPALSQQPAFGQKAVANSLRCMPGADNGSLGGKLGGFATKTHRMVRDDFFRVDFLAKIASADQNLVPFCVRQGATMCQPIGPGDRTQFQMTSKAISGGKVSSPYNDPNAGSNDNKYHIARTPYDNLYQCSVEFTRTGNATFNQIKLFDWENKEHRPQRGCALNNNGDSCDVPGLPQPLRLKRLGFFGTAVGFEYAPGTPMSNINQFDWDSDMVGTGRGPWTDPSTDPNRNPGRFCKVTPGSAASTENFDCWFPCYKKATGLP